jgi:rubrerythrin
MLLSTSLREGAARAAHHRRRRRPYTVTTKQEFQSVDEVLGFAISREEESCAFYTSLAARAERPGMQDVFQQFAGDELDHRIKLEQVRERKALLGTGGEVLDMHISDYLVPGDSSPDMDYQQALIVAMQKEQAAVALYTDLAGRLNDSALRTLFLGLAQEESRHRLRFEVEYDDTILTDN